MGMKVVGCVSVRMTEDVGVRGGSVNINCKLWCQNSL